MDKIDKTALSREAHLSPEGHLSGGEAALSAAKRIYPFPRSPFSGNN